MRPPEAGKKLTGVPETSHGADIWIITDEQAEGYYLENGFYTVKHILFEVDQVEVVEEKFESSEKVLALIKDGSEFDQMMRLYSEDADLHKCPNGEWPYSV